MAQASLHLGRNVLGADRFCPNVQKSNTRVRRPARFLSSPPLFFSKLTFFCGSIYFNDKPDGLLFTPLTKNADI